MRGVLPREKKSTSQFTVDAVLVGSLSLGLNLTKGKAFLLIFSSDNKFVNCAYCQSQLFPLVLLLMKNLVM